MVEDYEGGCGGRQVVRERLFSLLSFFSLSDGYWLFFCLHCGVILSFFWECFGSLLERRCLPLFDSDTHLGRE